MIQSVTIAKGIGVILVVMGHYLPIDSPSYWRLLNHTIYLFHMPLFLILSGFLYSKNAENKNLSIKYLRKKFERLMIPFSSIALISFFIKYLASKYFILDHPVNLKKFFLIFITPENTYFALVWFLYTLFMIFAIFPILKKIFHFRYLIMAVSILLIFVRWPDCFYLKHVFRSLPFFCFGALFLNEIDLDNMDARKACYALVLAITVFLFLAFIDDSFDKRSPYIKFVKLIFGLSGSVAVIFFSVIIKNTLNQYKLSNIIYVIGFYSMSIYLLHTVFSSAVRIFNYQILKANLFLAPALIAIFAGILFPLWLETHVLRKNQLTRKFILGLK